MTTQRGKTAAAKKWIAKQKKKGNKTKVITPYDMRLCDGNPNNNTGDTNYYRPENTFPFYNL